MLVLLLGAVAAFTYGLAVAVNGFYWDFLAGLAGVHGNGGAAGEFARAAALWVAPVLLLCGGICCCSCVGGLVVVAWKGGDWVEWMLEFGEERRSRQLEKQQPRSVKTPQHRVARVDPFYPAARAQGGPLYSTQPPDQPTGTAPTSKLPAQRESNRPDVSRASKVTVEGMKLVADVGKLIAPYKPPKGNPLVSWLNSTLLPVFDGSTVQEALAQAELEEPTARAVYRNLANKVPGVPGAAQRMANAKKGPTVRDHVAEKRYARALKELAALLAKRAGGEGAAWTALTSTRQEAMSPGVYLDSFETACGQVEDLGGITERDKLRYFKDQSSGKLFELLAGASVTTFERAREKVQTAEAIWKREERGELAAHGVDHWRAGDRRQGGGGPPGGPRQQQKSGGLDRGKILELRAEKGCNFHQKGTRPFGDDCQYRHDPAKKGTQAATSEDAQKAETLFEDVEFAKKKETEAGSGGGSKKLPSYPVFSADEELFVGALTADELDGPRLVPGRIAQATVRIGGEMRALGIDSCSAGAFWPVKDFEVLHKAAPEQARHGGEMKKSRTYSAFGGDAVPMVGRWVDLVCEFEDADTGVLGI